jgi:SRSO17 transposase
MPFTLDSSEFPKKGKDSAGVAPQYCGHLGKIANCQSGVFLGYASEKGYGLLDQQLYVPEQWFGPEYAGRRRKTDFPESLTFKTKPQLALELLEKAEQNGSFPGHWIAVDSIYGSDPLFLDTIGEKYNYFADIRSNAQFWLERPEVCLPSYKGRGRYPKKEKPDNDPLRVSEIAKKSSLHWETANLGEGAKGPIIAQVARLRVIEHKDGLPGKELWLFLRRNADGEVKYSISNAPVDMPLEEMIRVSKMRWTIEQLFQEGKSYLGMDHYEVRSYPGWHRHMALVTMAMHFLLDVRLQFGEKKLYYAAHSTEATYCFPD